MRLGTMLKKLLITLNKTIEALRIYSNNKIAISIDRGREGETVGEPL